MSFAGSEGLQQLVTAEFFVLYVGEGVIVNQLVTFLHSAQKCVWNGWLVSWVLY